MLTTGRCRRNAQITEGKGVFGSFEAARKPADGVRTGLQWVASASIPDRINANLLIANCRNFQQIRPKSPWAASASYIFSTWYRVDPSAQPGCVPRPEQSVGYAPGPPRHGRTPLPASLAGHHLAAAPGKLDEIVSQQYGQ
jgi:hypothetical protein